MANSNEKAPNTGLSINLHPLPILSISEHYMRTKLQSNNSNTKVIGALLGTESGRQVSIVNTLELLIRPSANDVNMDGESQAGAPFDQEFLQKRQSQYAEVFPALILLGWYTIGDLIHDVDVQLHQQFCSAVENPFFLLLSPSAVVSSGADLPLKIYQSALGSEVVSAGAPSQAASSFVEIAYSIDTEESERIAVDGAAKGLGAVGGADDSHGQQEADALVAHLNTQRNAIRMLHEKMLVLLQYINGVMDGTARKDPQVVRQISALVSTLPVMSESGFKDEFLTEYTDVQMTAYLATLTKQMASLNDLTDKFAVVHQPAEDMLHGSNRGPGGGKRGMNMAGMMMGQLDTRSGNTKSNKNKGGK